MKGLIRFTGSIAPAFCFLICLSCKQSINERTKGDISAPSIKKDSVRFIRNASGTAATLTFETTTPINCEIALWSILPNIPPSEDKPQMHTCPSEPKSSLSINIQPISQNTTYAMNLRMWNKAQSKENAKSIRINEKTGAEVPTPNEDKEVKDLIVARLVVPLKSSEIYSHKLPKPQPLTNIRLSITKSIACGEPMIEKSNFPPNQTNELKFLSLDGFARANAVPHPNFPNLMLANFDSIQEKLGLDWSYQWHDKQYEFSSQSPGYLDNFRLNNKDQNRIRDKDFSTSFKTFSISSENEISIEWLPKNPSITSYLIVKFLGPTPKDSLECRYPGSLGSGKIPPEFVKKLPNGHYKFLAIFETIQIHYRDGGPTWIIKSHDWRYANIDKVG